MTFPKVGIVCATYLESNQKYLDECLKSIKNLNYPKDRIEVMIKSSGDYEPEVDLDTPYFHMLHHSRQIHYPESINLGIEELKNRFGDVFDYYLLLNDDTILTTNSLTQLVTGAKDSLAIHQPISNCDNGWRYYLPMPMSLNKRFYRIEEFSPIMLTLMTGAISEFPMSFIIPEWVALYATLIPKKVWDIVGPLDPKFKTGQDDVDYCKRAKAHGIPCLINLSALIWHFGGVTADQALTPEIRAENIRYFEEKWNEKLI